MSYDTLLAKSPFVIFRPGAPSAGLAVETWAEVQAFVALRAGTVSVYIDASLIEPHVPAASGVTDFQNRTWIRAANGLADYIIIDDGATLANIAGFETIFVGANTQGAVPAFSWDDAEAYVQLRDGAALGDTATSTQPAIHLVAGHFLTLNCLMLAGLALTTATPFISVDAGATVQILGLTSSLRGPGSAPLGATWATGAGNATAAYDSSTVTQSGGAPASPGVAGTATLIQIDSREVALTFAASTVNALSTVAYLPAHGVVSITAEGFGGSGGGGGGQGGSVGAGSGVGGGAAGGCQYQRASFSFDLSHQLDVTIGAAGGPGAAGVDPSGAGGNGTDGSPSIATDATSGIILAALVGSSGGGGGANGPSSSHGGATYPGSFYPKSADIGVGSGQGFIAAGGFGGNAALDGDAGQVSLVTLNHPGGGGNNWTGGAGGSGASGAGGGGGGGAGPFADGAVGGAGGAGVGVDGTTPAANTGAGAGGGGGGGNAGGNGGAGGGGSTGWLKLSFIAPP